MDLLTNTMGPVVLTKRISLLEDKALKDLFSSVPVQRKKETMSGRRPQITTIQLQPNTEVEQNIEKRMHSFSPFTLSPKGVACVKSPSRLLNEPLSHSPMHTQEALLILNEIGRGSTAKVRPFQNVPFEQKS